MWDFRKERIIWIYFRLIEALADNVFIQANKNANNIEHHSILINLEDWIYFNVSHVNVLWIVMQRLNPNKISQI